MDSSHHTHHAQVARDDAYQCSGYWGEAAQGSTLLKGPTFLWARSASMSARINSAFRQAAAPGTDWMPTEVIDYAASAFASQLDIASALMHDGHESIATLVHHDKIQHDGALD